LDRHKDSRSQRATVELTVDTIGARGDGVATWRGKPVFLPFTVPGDCVRAQVGVPRGAGHEGRVLERLAGGPGRSEPVCRHFGRCGGCALQHLAIEDYQAVKLGALQAALRRAGLDPAVVAPLRTVLPGRRRVRLGVSRPRDPRAPALIGYRERFRHDLVDVHECPVLEPALFALLEPLRRIAPALLPPGGNAEAMLTRCDSGVDLLIECATPPGLSALETLAGFAEEHDLARVVWRNRSDDIPVVERRPARVVLSGVQVPFPSGGFLQATAAAEALLVGAVVAVVGGRHPVLDLYAGLGTFTFALAQSGAVHAAEGDGAAIAALLRAALALPRVTAERRDLDRDPVSGKELEGYGAAVFDPPRAGAIRQAAALADSAIATVVAVSCNPATFARDARRLVAGGFRLEKVVPIDQFVWTPHLELVAAFRR
jgi:23S rRNA (uracil1939-C5)-methyltransferase